MIAHVAAFPLEELLPAITGAARAAAGACEGRLGCEPSWRTRSRWSAPSPRPAQRVFDAFTSEEVMRRWWHAGRDWETPEASVDLRVGGRCGW